MQAFTILVITRRKGICLNMKNIYISKEKDTQELKTVTTYFRAGGDQTAEGTEGNENFSLDNFKFLFLNYMNFYLF